MRNIIPATASITPLPPRVKDLTGRVFGLLTVKEFAGIADNRAANWLCVCDCGKPFTVDGRSLTRKFTRSCGCYRSAVSRKCHTTHGASYTDIYCIWRGIKRRIECPSDARYKRYGGAGLTLSKEWSGSFLTFAKDMGPRPSKKHTVERINNLLGYSKENCRWATYKEQARNRSNNRILEWRGEKMPLCVLAERYGMADQVLNKRLKKGMSLEESLMTPVRNYKKAPPQWRGEAEDFLT